MDACGLLTQRLPSYSISVLCRRVWLHTRTHVVRPRRRRSGVARGSGGMPPYAQSKLLSICIARDLDRCGAARL